MIDMIEILSKTKISQKQIASLSKKTKEKVINAMALEMENSRKTILDANKKDIINARHNSLNQAMIERLSLDDKKIDYMICSLKQTAVLKDPVGRILSTWKNDSGLKLKKISIPIGVICVIYESRPNVTAEVASVCFKSGNACVLKGGKEAKFSNKAIIEAIHKALKKFNINENAITFMDDMKRQDTAKLIKMNDFIDVIIPRGGSELIKFITNNSTIPVIKHDKGICHIFIDESANLKDAIKICINAKCQKPSACNAVETILIHENIALNILPKLKQKFDKFNVKIYGCEKTSKIIGCDIATDENFNTEYLDFALNIKIVTSIDKAISHILKFTSNHSEAILSQNKKNIKTFFNSLESSCLYANASTRFSDGYEFGFGAEVGISTNRLHARGPVGLNELTTYKYIAEGNGQIRK